MFGLVYVSSAAGQFSKTELIDLLEKSRKNNAALNVTGILLYRDGNIMQVLEGEEETVWSLFGKIERDPRHSGVLILTKGRTEQRQFPDWSMAFRDLDSPEVRELPGYSEFMNTSLTDPEFQSNPGRVHKLLATFRKSMR